MDFVSPLSRRCSTKLWRDSQPVVLRGSRRKDLVQSVRSLELHDPDQAIVQTVNAMVELCSGFLTLHHCVVRQKKTEDEESLNDALQRHHTSQPERFKLGRRPCASARSKIESKRLNCSCSKQDHDNINIESQRIRTTAVRKIITRDTSRTVVILQSTSLWLSAGHRNHDLAMAQQSHSKTIHHPGMTHQLLDNNTPCVTMLRYTIKKHNASQYE